MIKFFRTRKRRLPFAEARMVKMVRSLFLELQIDFPKRALAVMVSPDLKECTLREYRCHISAFGYLVFETHTDLAKVYLSLQGKIVAEVLIIPLTPDPLLEEVKRKLESIASSSSSSSPLTVQPVLGHLPL